SQYEVPAQVEGAAYRGIYDTYWAWKKEIWLKGLLAESGYELSLVAGIATGALVKGGSRSEVPAQDSTHGALGLRGGLLGVQTQSHIGRIIISKLTYKLGRLLLPSPIGFRMEPQLGLYVRLGEMLGLGYTTIGIRARLGPVVVWMVFPQLDPSRRYKKDRIVAIVEGEAHGGLGLRGGLLGAMDEEMNSMKVNEVWIEVVPPPNAKVVRSKWLFKKKTDIDGEVHTYKARLLAKGCTQTYEIDYEETFSPVADIRAIRILIAIAAYYDYEIWQMDVKTAFLNGRLDEDIYMKQPEGNVNPKYPKCVCKLQRSIYGLKQASHQWNKRFDEEIKKFGFTQNHDEPCVYRKASGREAAYILGIKIYRDISKRLIRLSQSAYIDKILKKFNMHNFKKGYSPMEVKHELSNEMCASTLEEVAYMKKVPYALAVGSILYAVRCTRPDVAFAQNLVSRYQQNTGKLHWVAVKHILKYPRNTRDVFLVYGGKPDTDLNVTGFCDASWQCDKDDTKSQMGYVFVVNGGAVDWKSKKQTTIAMSATQAEYMAASEAAMEAVWIRKFVGDLGVMPSIKEPINMYCDNSAAIILAKDSGIMK
ncbi:retrotransposon protein, putative, ty1-copia subclass, partial [Tanacetum coccineum]